MDWKVLFKVLGKVALFSLGFALQLAVFSLAVIYLDMWALLIIALYLLYFIIKHMYQDELIRQGKR